jgi:hypothetical protein
MILLTGVVAATGSATAIQGTADVIGRLQLLLEVSHLLYIMRFHLGYTLYMHHCGRDKLLIVQLAQQD